MSILAWFFLAIGIIIALVILWFIAIILSGMRSRDNKYYDPEDKKWHPMVLLTVEQLSRIQNGTRKLKKRDTNDIIKTNMPQIELLPLEELIKVLDEKGVDYDELDISDQYFPLKDVEACMNAKIIAEPNHRPCPLCKKPSEELQWIYFKSPDWTWKRLCGRAGPMSICPDCGCIVEFKIFMMS